MVSSGSGAHGVRFLGTSAVGWLIRVAVASSTSATASSRRKFCQVLGGRAVPGTTSDLVMGESVTPEHLHERLAQMADPAVDAIFVGTVNETSTGVVKLDVTRPDRGRPRTRWSR